MEIEFEKRILGNYDLFMRSQYIQGKLSYKLSYNLCVESSESLLSYSTDFVPKLVSTVIGTETRIYRHRY